MKHPVIGLNCKLAEERGDFYYKLDRHYPDAVTRAGGMPLILPFVKTAGEAREWLGRVDAVLFTGGPDINSKRWGEPLHRKAVLMPKDKEDSDFAYAKEALRRDVPVLGICLGCQLLNVALGGSLHQHIDGHREGVRHEVGVEPSRLRGIIGARATVNSYHHQAVNGVGKGLAVTARAGDGTIEGLESAKHRFVLAVQWHPERITGQREQMALFKALVDAARRS